MTDGQAPSLPIPGHVFERKYRIQSVIGSGGFAQVYLAQFEEVERDVAIKVLVPDGKPPNLYPDELDKRFLREAQMLSQLKDPRTVTLYDFGRSEAGLLYMVFEFVDGTPLHELVRMQGAIEQTRVLRIMRQVLQSLREAHAIGILHRDIKPANIMVYDYMGEQDNVKVLDFGIAKSLKEELKYQAGKDLTRDGTIMGTPRYMSPEQICRQPLGAASDIYSLGLVCFELLIGARAINHTLDTDVIRVHLGPEPFALPGSIPIHPAARAIVEKMIEKDFRNRYQTAEECLNEIDALLASGLLDQTMPMSVPLSGDYVQQPISTTAQNANLAATSTMGGIPGNAPSLGFGTQNAPPQMHTVYPPQHNGQALPEVDSTNATQPMASPPNAMMPQTGFGPPPGQVIPQNVGHNVGGPIQTQVQVQMTPQRLEMALPAVASKTSLVGLGGTVVVFLLLFTVTSFFWIFGLAAIVVAAGVAFQSSHLVINRGDHFEVVTKYLTYERPKLGSAQSIVRFEGQPFQDEIHFAMITQDGTVNLSRGLSAEEVAVLCEQGNRWLAGQV